MTPHDAFVGFFCVVRGDRRSLKITAGRVETTGHLMETTLNCNKVLQRIAKLIVKISVCVFLVSAVMFTHQKFYVKDLYRVKSPSAELNCHVPDSN